LTRFFAGLATAVARAELLVKSGAWIRLKPFFAAGTFLEKMLGWHPAFLTDLGYYTAWMQIWTFRFFTRRNILAV